MSPESIGRYTRPEARNTNIVIVRRRGPNWQLWVLIYAMELSPSTKNRENYLINN